MIRKITAIIASLACAAVIVSLVPEFSSEVAAHASQPVDQSASIAAAAYMHAQVSERTTAGIRSATEQDIRSVYPGGKTACTQSWPNYEQACLRDDRQVDGNLRVVRVIAIDHSAAKPLRR
jgi:hypothetical protein